MNKLQIKYINEVENLLFSKLPYSHTFQLSKDAMIYIGIWKNKNITITLQFRDTINFEKGYSVFYNGQLTVKKRFDKFILFLKKMLSEK